MSTSTAIESPAPWVVLRSSFDRLLVPLVQLSLVLLLIYQYQLESRTFFQIAVLTVAGFAVHAVLPLAYRLRFFVLLSFAGIGVAFGWQDGGLMVACGLLLIGICHLPIGFWKRVSLLLALGSIFAAARAGMIVSPWSAAVWPILASMFMFRLAVYLYALQHDKTPVDPYRSLAYFFMLPNVCFPLFPVVDYGTFGRTYYDKSEAEIYQRGIDWIVRGLVQLLLYRFVYLNLMENPADLQGLGDVVQFMLATFLLYLRVSGQFHLIVGMLHLFGFRLPETHRLYYLASSFTDFWRRINIYWKDFMMKLVYYPSFFRLRRWGDRTALIGATIIVFLSTWVLHSYQWFWLRGGFPITAQDGIFWGVLGGFVVFNSLREIKRGRKRVVGKAETWDFERGFRTAAMFWGMTVLWSLWSSESLSTWFGLWATAMRIDVYGLTLIGIVTLGFVLAGAREWTPRTGLESTFGNRLLGRRSQNIAVMCALLLVTLPTVSRPLGTGPSALISSLQANTLNAADAELQNRGYYEQLDNASRLSSQLWELQTGEPEGWNRFGDTEGERQRSDLLLTDIQPLSSFDFKGAPLTTNQWGMRDREYDKDKPQGVYRIALLGPSITMGSGVGDDETFENLLESRLNEERPIDGFSQYEILNFSIPGHSVLQQLVLLEDRVLDYEPDAVIITVPGERNLEAPLARNLARALVAGYSIPYPDLVALLNQNGIDVGDPGARPIPTAFLRDVLRRAGVETSAPEEEVQAKLRRVSGELLSWTFSRIGAICDEAGIEPVMLALDVVGDRTASSPAVEGFAAEHGYALLDLYDVYAVPDTMSLRIAPWDDHPNAEAHRMIADRLYEDLTVPGGFFDNISDSSLNP